MKNIVLAIVCAFWVFDVQADDKLKPFVLASKSTESVEALKTQVEAKLTEAGFMVLGNYTPYPNTLVLGFTNEEVKNNAAQSEHGGFGAALRVTLTKVGNEVQVSYTNPVYMANAYRMNGDLANTYSQLEKALGKIEEYGAGGLKAKELKKYHYMIGMEYFTDPKTVGEYDSYENAVAIIETNLKAGKNGSKLVYRVDVPGKKETLFAVGLLGENKYANDQYIMSKIDFKDIKSTPHLPYEILVVDNKAIALYARFRIAMSFPDLKMMGSNSFVSIMESPDAINDALKAVCTK